MTQPALLISSNLKQSRYPENFAGFVNMETGTSCVGKEQAQGHLIDRYRQDKVGCFGGSKYVPTQSICLEFPQGWKGVVAGRWAALATGSRPGRRRAAAAVHGDSRHVPRDSGQVRK